MAEGKIVRTRIAPSPTGYPHIGTVYQALFDYIFAKKHNGQFVVRIEDTDRNRFVEGAEEIIYQSLEWFKLEPDESPPKGGPYKPYRSSERLDLYQKYVEELVEDGHAYYCFCTLERLAAMRDEQQKMGKVPKYDRLCLNLSAEEVKQKLDQGVPHVTRMKIPENTKICVEDQIAGLVMFNSNELDDQVLLKSDGYPTYHLAVVVDDYLMKITHVFRGTEWLPSTPKHVLLYQFFGWEDQIPEFTHLPLILNADAPGKLSKRNAASSVDFYRSEGYLPEAVLNYLSNVVWNHPEGKEVYPLDEFIKLFEIKDLESKGAKFDLKKLDWMNGEYIRQMDDEDLADRLIDYLKTLPVQSEEVQEAIEGKEVKKTAELPQGMTGEKIRQLAPLVKERVKKLSDFLPLTAWMFEEVEYDKQFFDRTKVDDPAKVLQRVLEEMENLETPWRKELFEQAFQDLAKELSLSKTEMFQLIRVAVSGQLVTPPLFESIQIVGEEKTVERVKVAIRFLS